MAKVGKNANCLAGMKCPKCGSFGPYRIAVETIMEVSDDGSGEHADIDWRDGAFCECRECQYQGKVVDFKEQKDETGKRHTGKDIVTAHPFHVLGNEDQKKVSLRYFKFYLEENHGDREYSYPYFVTALNIKEARQKIEVKITGFYRDGELYRRDGDKTSSHTYKTQIDGILFCANHIQEVPKQELMEAIIAHACADDWEDLREEEDKE